MGLAVERFAKRLGATRDAPVQRGCGYAELMYTSTFTFAPREFDDEFHTLDQEIAQVARSTPGYLGEECWENPSTGLVANVYYWQTMESLQALMKHPAHIAAKQRQQRWLKGYQVVIGQVVGCYGDGGIAHPLAGMTQDRAGAEPLFLSALSPIESPTG